MASREILDLLPDVAQKAKEIPLTRGLVASIDATDYEQLAAAKWMAMRRKDGKCFYACRFVGGRKDRVCVYMHRVVMEAGAGQQIDHIDGDGLNNRRDNLRFSTQSQNVSNSRQRKSISGFRGVRLFQGRRKPWLAEIKVSKRRYSLGSFCSAEDAARAYDVAARQHHGQFARTNFDG